MSTIPEHIEAIRLFRADVKAPPKWMSADFAQLQYQTQCVTFVEAHIDEIADLVKQRDAETWPMCAADADRMERAAVAVEDLTQQRTFLLEAIKEVGGEELLTIVTIALQKRLASLEEAERRVQ